MSLGYPYSYKDELTPKMARLNLFLFMTGFIGFLLLAPKPAQAQFAHGFNNRNIPRCRNYGIISRGATSLSSHVQDPANNGHQNNKMTLSEYNKEFDVIFGNKQLQKKFKHAKAFGVIGDFNMGNSKLFKEAIISHMKDPSTEFIQGTYKKDAVNHYFNPDNGLNVMFNPQTKRFISGWHLNEEQLLRMKLRMKLDGSL